MQELLTPQEEIKRSVSIRYDERPNEALHLLTDSEDEARLGAASFRNLHIQEQAKEQSIIHGHFSVRMKNYVVTQ